MRGKSVECWQAKWNKLSEKLPLQAQQGFEIAKKLLAEYSGADSFFGASVGRFLSGRWNTHHGDLVLQALNAVRPPKLSFLESFGSVHRDSFEPTALARTQDLLAKLKRNLANEQLDLDGDLSHIIQVIEKNMNLYYKDIDANIDYVKEDVARQEAENNSRQETERAKYCISRNIWKQDF